MPNNEMTVESLISEAKTFKPEVLEATKAYARSKPWKGTQAERQEKLMTLHTALCAAYELTLGLKFIDIRDANLHGGMAISGRGANRAIVITGKVSVINYLHAFTKARGAGQRECYKWSLNLFKRCFPKSFDKSEKIGPNLFAAGTTARLDALREAAEAAERERNEEQERRDAEYDANGEL
jgi:hypothetical protein